MSSAIGLALDWLSTLSLTFGGCCSNALTLELITTQYPPFGTLITFSQFLFVSILGAPKLLCVTPRRISRQEAFRCIEKLARRPPKNRRRAAIAVAHCGLSDSPEKNIISQFSQELSKHLEQNLNSNVSFADFSRIDSLKSEKEAPLIEITQLPHPQNARDLKNYDIVVIIQSATRTEQIDFRPLLLGSSCVVLELENEDSFQHLILRHPTRPLDACNPLRYRLKPRRIPLSNYLLQVIIFLVISLLNNAAFAYRIPMSVHIVFRSGGPVVNMLIGCTLRKVRYTRTQVFSIAVVTIGIFLTTFASMLSKPPKSHSPSTTATATASSEHRSTFALGICILSAALILSGFLGLVQDETSRRYGRGHWQESMFYLHSMALPMFLFAGPELRSQIHRANATPPVQVDAASLSSALQLFGVQPPNPSPSPSALAHLPPLPFLPIRLPSLRIPSVYIPLAANLLTQFICVAGVNRLSSSVNSLTVTLILAVRKAVSLAISVVLVGNSRGNVYLWAGAFAVLLGTAGYAIGSAAKPKDKKE